MTSLHQVYQPTGSLLVLLDLQTRVLGNGNVVTPSRSGKIYGLGAREPPGKESGTDSEGTSTGDRLSDCKLSERRMLALKPHFQFRKQQTHSVLDKRLRVLAVGELSSEFSKVGETSDGKVLLVLHSFGEDLLGLLHGGKDVRLA